MLRGFGQPVSRKGACDGENKDMEQTAHHFHAAVVELEYLTHPVQGSNL